MVQEADKGLVKDRKLAEGRNQSKADGGRNQRETEGGRIKIEWLEGVANH